jgi:hypothetical protein
VVRETEIADTAPARRGVFITNGRGLLDCARLFVSLNILIVTPTRFRKALSAHSTTAAAA